MLSWLKKRRRARIEREPFPGEWIGILEKHVALYRALTQRERGVLHGQLRVFIAEHEWEGCRGQEITRDVQLIVAAQACMLTLGLGMDQYDNVRTILVYPTAYRSRAQEADELGVVSVDGEAREGEAWENGAVVLSWKDVRHDASRLDGRNLVLHEFAHQLDMGDGAANGTPLLRDREMAVRWNAVMTEAYRGLKEGSANSGEVLDRYGAEDESEFFAVATEAFFELPAEVARQHPRLYALLKDYYRLDPLKSEPS